MPFPPCPSGCDRPLSADDGPDRCLQCLGFQHAEDAFVDDSCVCCGRMSMTSLRSCLSFLKGLAPFAATCARFSRQREPLSGALGDLRVTVRVFCLFCRWSKGQRYPLTQRKSNFLFLRVLRSLGWQCATPCFLTYLWPVPFGTQGVRWGCLRRHRLLYHPSLLPFAAPPPVRRLCRWSRLHSIWRHGSCCPACLAGSQSQLSATRFSSPGDLPIQLRSRDVGGSPERPCLARGDCCPPGKGCNWAGPSSRDEAGVSQPLLHRTQERWSTTNPGSASLEPGFAQAPVQDADVQLHYQMHPAPGLVCSDRPEGCLHSCFDPSVTQTVPTVCVRGSGMVVQGPPPRALPVSPCLYEGRRGRPYPASGSRCQGPQLPRQLAYLGPIQRAFVRSQGLGAFGTSASGGFGSTGKRASSPLCRESLFSVWS